MLAVTVHIISVEEHVNITVVIKIWATLEASPILFMYLNMQLYSIVCFQMFLYLFLEFFDSVGDVDYCGMHSLSYVDDYPSEGLYQNFVHILATLFNRLVSKLFKMFMLNA